MSRPSGTASAWLSLLLSAFFPAVFCSPAAGDKTVVFDPLPRHLDHFEVLPDGTRLFFGSGRDAYVFDAAGRQVDKFSSPMPVNELIPLPNGWFIACLGYNGGQMALFRPDGSYAKRLVAKGRPPAQFRGDMTGWTSPTDAAVDAEAKLMFAADVTMAPRDDRKIPDPDFSRIAVFDLDGKFVRSIHAYDYYSKDEAAKNDGARAWYGDLEVDPKRKVLYATARKRRELIAFDYEGRILHRVRGPAGGIAVFPDGRVAAAVGERVQIYGADLKPVGQVTARYAGRGLGLLDVETDAAGRLYASAHDQSVTFVRWDEKLANPKVFGPRYASIHVGSSGFALKAGQEFGIAVRVESRPAPEAGTPWQVMVRPGDGSDLCWQVLAHRVEAGKLVVRVPEAARGVYELAVKYGRGPIAWGDRARELYEQRTVVFAEASPGGCVAAVPSTGRRAYRRGQAVPLTIIRRADKAEPTEVRVRLRGPGGAVRAEAKVTVASLGHYEIPAETTRKLAPGRYVIEPGAAGCRGYPLTITIVQAGPDSPMQRILYHEFGQAVGMRDEGFQDAAERKAFIRNATEMNQWMRWTRETDRAGHGMIGRAPVAWGRDRMRGYLKDPAFAPAEYYELPHGLWSIEYYLDQAVTRGVRYDTQMLYHCDSVYFRDWRLDRAVPAIQQIAQWMGRWPSFYGFNYNDEMFFGGWAQGWTQADKDWLAKVKKEKFGGNHVRTLMHGLRTMYGAFNAAVREARPELKITTTPMWQYPAVEGSYAPVIYEGMDETYSHFLSEGYQYPWYPAHSAALLRLPGKALMGCFDNGTSMLAGDIYLKNAMQVLAQGTQGVGVEHTTAFKDPWGAKAYRTANTIARLFGPVFAEIPPAPAAAVLYSYTQDVTERRNSLGTPHFERVFTLYGAGLMAGVPMQIVYEESVADGYLLDGAKPRFGMLILAGQKQALPEKVARGVRAYAAAGGKLRLDEVLDPKSNGVAELKPKVLGLDSHVLKRAFHEGYAADSMAPLCQPILERFAVDLRKALEGDVRFGMRTDDPWVGKTRFDGGQVQYVMLFTETSPYPWEAGTVWSLGTMYCKHASTWLPRVTRVTLPKAGRVHDLFDQREIKTTSSGNVMQFDADLRTWPARLYAVCARPMGNPTLAIRRADGGRLRLAAQVCDEGGRSMKARVPMRVRLFAGEETALDYTAASGADGALSGDIDVPVTHSRWTLEVAELITGKAVRVDVGPQATLGRLLAERGDAEVLRAGRVRYLVDLAGKRGGLVLSMGAAGHLGDGQIKALRDALAKRGVALRTDAALKPPAEPGVYLATGTVGDNKQSVLVSQALAKGLVAMAVTHNAPGPGRGLVTAAFAPRRRDEHAVVLLGGDAGGLAKAADAFVKHLASSARAPVAAPIQWSAAVTAGRAASVELPKLAEQVGVFLDEVRPSGDGSHLVVTARGFHDNVALVKDTGRSAEVVRSVRVGQGNRVVSPYVSGDGEVFGASGLTVHRHGEALELLGASGGGLQAFAAFGAVGRQPHRFGVSADGRTVVAPGSYGVACWRKRGDRWQQAWTVDYWKQFDKLDWPVHGVNHRTPQFHAVVPDGADYALVLFCENSNNGWVQPQHHNAAALSARELLSGRERWRFDVPIPKSQLFANLHTSPSGKRVMLHVQIGSWRQESHRYFSLSADGKAVGSWGTGQGVTPLDVAVSDATGRIALVFQRRLLEVRAPDATLLHNLIWPTQPVSVAFAPDGKRLLVCDDRGRLSCLDETGKRLWQRDIGCVSRLRVAGERAYAAGWDGRLRSYRLGGEHRWTVDLTPAMVHERPLTAYAKSAEHRPGNLLAVAGAPTTSAAIPPGENLLATGQAALEIGGTPSWMSDGKVQIKAEQLTNGKTDDVTTPWLHVDELFWDATAGRPVFAEITFKKPTDVTSLTVHENPAKGESFPTEAVVQVWNAKLQRWDTAAFGLFLRGAVNTYRLSLKGVSKLRYVPWSSYYRNFHTSEIEVRGAAADK